MNLSVIIPAYNVEKYIERCLDSILRNHVEKMEIIIINDGSKDSTLHILKRYQKKHKNIIVIDQSNQGQAIARNKAIDLAKGKYITFIDSDDFITENMLTKMYQKACEKDYDLIYCDYYEYYGENNIKVFKNNAAIDVGEKQNAILSNYAPWGKLYKKSLFEQYPLRFLERKLFEDIVIIPILNGLAKTSYYIQQPLYYYNHENDSSIRKKSYSKRLEDVFDAIDMTYENTVAYGLLEKYPNEIEYLFMDSFFKGSVFRFADFKEGLPHIKMVRENIMKKFPHMRKNPYYKKQSLYIKLLYHLCFFYPPRLIYMIKRLKK